MDEQRRHQEIWRVLYRLTNGPIKSVFNLDSEPCSVDGPCIVISNHVTNYDPFLVAMSFPDKQLYYVASEHIFRHALASRALEWMLSPIARKKGDSGFGAVREILKRTKKGSSICLFAEGDCTWDGYSAPVLPATGKMVRSSGATLVTYRIEGGYFTSPRWGRGVRRGKIRGHAVGVYPPEELKKMKGPAITELIDRDLFEDAWTRQAQEQVRFRSKHPAEDLETALYLCPGCKRIGTLQSSGFTLRCRECGLETTYREDGLFHPDVPFANVADWDQWQRNALLNGDYVHGDVLFSDEAVSFRRILSDHHTETLSGGRLVQLKDHIRCGSHVFPLKDIENMAMVKRNILLFTCGGEYYEIRCGKKSNMRKYLELWKQADASAESEHR